MLDPKTRVALIVLRALRQPHNDLNSQDDIARKAAAEICQMFGPEIKALREVSRQAAARGRAEGVLATSETAGVVEGWRARAEAAEARVKSLLGLLSKNPAALAHLFPQEPLDADMARIWSENIDRLYES